MKLEIRTLADISALAPCYSPKRYLSEGWTGTVLDILKIEECPARDRLWVVLRDGWIDDRTLRLFAVWCAREALKLVVTPDLRSVEACNVAERFANGEATQEELAPARDAARDAAWAAAWAAARDAAWDAAWAAARAAARDAAWAAARAAARAPASAAARDAARAPASAAARDAARAPARDAARAPASAAARDAARDAQIQELIRLITASVGESAKPKRKRKAAKAVAE